MQNINNDAYLIDAIDKILLHHTEDPNFKQVEYTVKQFLRLYFETIAVLNSEKANSLRQEIYKILQVIDYKSLFDSYRIVQKFIKDFKNENESN